MTVFRVEVEGVSDFLESDLCGKVLHFVDVSAEMANVIRV